MSASPIILAVSPPTSIISNSHHHTQKRQVMIHSASSAAQRYSHRLSPSPPSSPLLTFTTSGSPPTLMVSRPVSPSSRYTSSTTATASPTLLSGSPNASSPLASIASLAVGSPPRNLHYSSSSLLSLSPPNKSYNHYAPHATTPLRVAFPHQNAVKPILKDNVRAWMEEDLVSQAISLSLEDVTMPMYPMSVVDSVRNKNVSISSPSSTSSSGRRIKNSLRFDRALERVCLFQSDATPSAIARGKRYTVTDPLAASESLPDNMDDDDSTLTHTARSSFEFQSSSPARRRVKMQGSTALAASSSPSTAKPPLPPASSTPRRWCLLSKTTPSALSPLPGGANVGLETVRLLESDDGHRLLLLCTVLVRNISFEKNLVAVYTTDGWSSTNQSMPALFRGTVSATMGGTVGVDRFSLEIEIDATKLPPSPQRQVSIEFALKCMMGGSEFWDNRGGANHVIEAVEVAATATTPTPATPRRASLTLDGEALKAYAAASKAAAEYAARLGEAMAADAVRISNEFQRKPVVSLIPAAAAPPSQPFQQQQPVRSVVVVKKTNGFGGNFGGTPFVGVEMPFSASPPFPYYGGCSLNGGSAGLTTGTMKGNF